VPLLSEQTSEVVSGQLIEAYGREFPGFLEDKGEQVAV
jgi:hypothetical protein